MFFSMKGIIPVENIMWPSMMVYLRVRILLASQSRLKNSLTIRKLGWRRRASLRGRGRLESPKMSSNCSGLYRVSEWRVDTHSWLRNQTSLVCVSVTLMPGGSWFGSLPNYGNHLGIIQISFEAPSLVAEGLPHFVTRNANGPSDRALW